MCTTICNFYQLLPTYNNKSSPNIWLGKQHNSDKKMMCAKEAKKMMNIRFDLNEDGDCHKTYGGKHFG